MNNNQSINQNMQNQQQFNTNQGVQQKKSSSVVKVLAIIGGFVVGVIVLAFVIISIVSATSSKLICKSNKGDITIMYNDEEIVGYSSNGLSYDLDKQKEYAKSIGIKAYLQEFELWFKSETSGSCTIKEK